MRLLVYILIMSKKNNITQFIFALVPYLLTFFLIYVGATAGADFVDVAFSLCGKMAPPTAECLQQSYMKNKHHSTNGALWGYAIATLLIWIWRCARVVFYKKRTR